MNQPSRCRVVHASAKLYIIVSHAGAVVCANMRQLPRFISTGLMKTCCSLLAENNCSWESGNVSEVVMMATKSKYKDKCCERC